MEHISIFNYEAFYLDFLEGNLNEEDTRLFLQFLEAHPELKVEEELPSFEVQGSLLSPEFKNNLKQVSFADEAVTLNNIEQFLIAETEGILTDEKLKEVTRFIASNGQFAHDRMLYNVAHLKPNHRITFVDKNKLKHRRAIALWPAVSFAAAASIAAFFLLNQPSTEPFNFDDVAVTIQRGEKSDSTENNQKAPIFPNYPEKNTAALPVQFAKDNVNPQPQKNGIIKTDVQLNPLKTASVRNINTHLKDQRLIKNNPNTRPTEVPTVEQTSYATLGFAEMNNPIQPITKRLSNLVDQEVDFRAAKPTREKSGGFYIKIGKLEISHKKH